MLEWNVSIVIIVILLGFLAAFIDAVVGGGGLISIPALLAVGMQPLNGVGYE
ncbi:membrane protein [Staphylococcus gallinarum]|uniref:Membrane protein n=1 Tax=Staphylococcus gallinarum TaxID=1293 RepID=A0A380FK61_STAGA|nr:membrane protein [Staphylococcus gallinarum]